ncbi:NAD(P)-dependent oxidoreductase [Mycolicibacterium sp. 120266]|jgi:3-hydroxyisobutyrate dehydrogenase|uniref:NAD(P)-dependent oxidoreductase n=1 Tax=Mycolicibacterium sp. 120266 TaxID=3090601 RepID=UPI00299D5936|nr:NAD(P)-dependent oxidoreductase [Mycolicibacterium sp. 120266]MDX1871632.1 NAD(P)-dependent oxidoreductase [Mycolicibacterium sp. 120266]
MVAVGMIGLGDMGAPMLARLLAAGYRVSAHDVDPARSHSAADAGARTVESPAEVAADSDVVISLVMSQDIPAAHFGEQGVLAGLRPDTVLVVGSTTTPEMVRQIRQRAGEDALLVDAPIVGGVRYAREGTVTFLAGGSAEAVDRAEPVLSALGTVERVGPYGSGAAYKLITNAFVMAAEAGLREALDLTDILGGDYATALRLFGLGPMAAVTARALDSSNPRPLRASAQDFDTLLSVVDDAASLPISAAGRDRLWAAVNAAPGFEPQFVDLTRRTTARSPYRAD